MQSQTPVRLTDRTRFQSFSEKSAAAAWVPSMPAFDVEREVDASEFFGSAPNHRLDIVRVRDVRAEGAKMADPHALLIRSAVS